MLDGRQSLQRLLCIYCHSDIKDIRSNTRSRLLGNGLRSHRPRQTAKRSCWARQARALKCRLTSTHGLERRRRHESCHGHVRFAEPAHAAELRLRLECYPQRPAPACSFRRCSGGSITYSGRTASTMQWPLDSQSAARAVASITWASISRRAAVARRPSGSSGAGWPRRRSPRAGRGRGRC